MAEKRESNKFHEEAFAIINAIAKYGMNDFKHLTYEDVTTVLKVHYSIQDKKKSIGQLTVDIDCSDALKGLKAITREAKKATEALKELGEQRKLNFGPGACGVCGVNHNHCMCPKGDKPKLYIDGVSEPFTAREGEVVYVLKDEADIRKIAKELNEQMKKESGKRGITY